MSQQPIQRSSVHHIQARHRAQFIQRYGWEAPGSYGKTSDERAALQNSVVLIDQSWLGKLECKGEWVGSLSELKIEGAAVYPLIPSHAIWIVQPSAVESAHVKLEALRSGKARSYLIDTSAGYASFDLLGPRAADVLCKMASAQVAPGQHAQAPVAGVHCLVIRKERGFQFHFGREYGEYLWECFLDAGHELGIHPAGLDVLS